MRKHIVLIMGMILMASGLLGAVIADDSRANDDTPQTAQTIDPGDTKIDNINENTDEMDWYVSDLLTGRLIRVNLTVAPGCDFDVYVFDENGSNDIYNATPIAMSNSWEYGGFEECSFGTTYNGNYYIVVVAFEGSGPYTMRLFDDGEFTDDGDNDKEHATDIGIGDTVNSDLDPDAGDEADWYKVSADPGDILVVNLTVPVTGDFDLYVIDSDGNDAGFSENDQLGGFEEITFGATRSARSSVYYIVCAAYSGFGDYVLKLTKSGTFVPDNDNDAGNATNINVGDTKSGSVWNGVDSSDWYELSLNAGDQVIIELEVPETGDFDILIYDDPDGWWLVGFGWNWGLGVDEFCGFEAQETKDYYIEVFASEGEGDYVLSVEDYTPDDNDDMGNAQEISLPLADIIEEQLIFGLDHYDYYKVSLEENDQIRVMLDYDIGNEFNLYLNDSMGMEIERSNTTSGYEEISYTCNDEGWYFICIETTWGSGDYSLDIDYVPGNEPPVIESPVPFEENIRVYEGEIVIFRIDVDDEKPAKLEYEWEVDGVVQTEISGDRFTITTSFTAQYSAGEYVIEVEVTDDKDETDTHGWNLTVLDVNLMPEINIAVPLLEVRDLEINETESILFEIEVSDRDGTKPLVQWILDDVELEGEDDEEFEFGTDHDMAGTYEIKVNVTDGADETIINSTTWTVTVMNVDRPPELMNRTPDKENVDTDEETSVEFGIDAVDPDGDVVEYEWYFDEEILEGQIGNRYVFEPDYDSSDGETHIVKVVVTTGGLEANHTWGLVVDNVNRMPAIDNNTLMPTPDIVIKSGVEFEFYIMAHDPDGDDLTYTWTIIETGETFENQSVLQKLKGGVYNIEVTVDDGNGGVDTYNFEIEIEKKPEGSPGFGVGLALLALIGMMVLVKYTQKKR